MKTKFHAFDIETLVINGQLKPYCICYYNGEYETIVGFNCVEEFVERIMKKPGKAVYFAHNLNFDGSFIMLYLLKKEIKIKYLIYKSNIYKISIETEISTIELKCSYRFFPLPLSAGHRLLKTNEKKEFDHSSINEDSLKDSSVIEKVKEYCINDVKIVMQMMEIYENCLKFVFPSWIKYNSISSTALNLFNKKFNKHCIEIKIEKELDNLIRPSYFGGRCEIFGNPYEHEMIYHFDFSGMYAESMLEDFPYGPLYSIESNFNIKKEAGFYLVDVQCEMEIPVLPLRIDGKLIFPNGNFSGLYWYEELNYFVKKGGIIKKIKKAFVFKNKGKTFKGFSKKIKSFRNKGMAENFIFKLINNSLYGRLGMAAQNNKSILIHGDKNAEKYLKHPFLIKYSVVNELYRITLENKTDRKVGSNVIYASIITSKSRIKLHRAFMDVIKGGGRVLYCDTDSVFAAFEKNIDNEKFGDVYFDINKEDTKILDAVFALPKAYALILEKNHKKIIKIKGIKNPNLSFEEFKNKFYMYDKDPFEQNQTLLKNDNLYYTEKNISKLINLSAYHYDKRLFFDNYKKSKAINIEKNI